MKTKIKKKKKNLEKHSISAIDEEIGEKISKLNE